MTKNVETIKGVFEGTVIRPNLNDDGVPYSYTLMEGDIELYELPMQVGHPNIKTGWSNEDLLSSVVNRVKLLDNFRPSAFNKVALDGLNKAIDMFNQRFEITTAARDFKLDKLPVYTLEYDPDITSYGDEQHTTVLATVFMGFAFFGHTLEELHQNVRSGNVGHYNDFWRVKDRFDLDSGFRFVNERFNPDTNTKEAYIDQLTKLGA